MGVDYTPFAIYGLELPDGTFEALVKAAAEKYLDRHATQETADAYYGGNLDAARDAYESDAYYEAKCEWEYKGLKIAEAGAACYGGDPTYYVGVLIEDLLDPDEVRAMWEQASDHPVLASLLKAGRAPAFHVELQIW